MKFPFNVRPGIAGWQLLYFKQGRYTKDTSQSEQWNRGAYLVQGLGHCEACHSPTNVLQAPKKGEALQGNVIDHWFAPDISGGRYSGIKGWSEQQIATYLKTGHNDKNEAAVGPMQQTIDLGTSHLSDADLGDIAIYLKNQVAGTADTEPKTKRPVTVAERASGQSIYTDNCAACHGANGRGTAGIAPTLAGASSVAGKRPDTAVRAVLQGFEPSGPWGVMPAFAEVFTADQVSDVVNYVRTSWGNNGPGRVDPSMVDHMARYADLGDSKVESAVVCPSAKAASLDPATLTQIKAMANEGSQPQAATDELVKDYRARHPKIGTTEIITTISGAYCRGVMATSKGTLAERQQRYVAFTGHVAQSASTVK
jgi:mono/diheme cytochrome c family protein